MQRSHLNITKLLFLLSVVCFMGACEEEEVDTENPKIVWNQPQFGEALGAGEDIIVDFSDNIGLKEASYEVIAADGTEALQIDMSLSGTSGEITWRNNGTVLKAGDYTINATVTDAAGNTNTGGNQFSVN